MRSELEASPVMDAQGFDAKLSVEKGHEATPAATVRFD